MISESFENGVVICGDCLEIMPVIASKTVDLILCDLPYGTSACKWDTVIPFDKLWENYNRLIEDCGGIVLFGSEPFSSKLRCSNLDLYKYDWKWEKPSAANFLNFKYQPAKVYEDIMVFGKSAVSYSKKGNMRYYPQMEKGEPYKQKSGKQKENYGNSSVRTPIKQVVTENTGDRYPRAIQKFSSDKDKLHPTQKPVALFEYMIKTYTNEGDLVLDNCSGSGTTAIACININRRFICIEKDRKYYDISVERIKNRYKELGK